MSSSQQREFEVGQSIAGSPYDVTATLGRGGMGTVYEVRHRELGRRFVLKVLHQHLGGRKDLISRMKNEWTALARLNDANIVQVTDAGYTDRGLPYYVMERLHGDTVAQLLRKEGALGVHRAVEITLDVLSGLSAAHGMGVIHRDIKPQNLFVLADGRAKVLDFGIAQVRLPAERVVTAAGVAIGTPRFMAPEQAEGRKVDGRADIYSLALVLYEMLLGRGPFAHIKDPNQLVLAHTALVPIRLDAVLAGVAAELADLVQRWLAKLPDERPFSAAAAREELAALAAELPGAPLPADDVTGEAAYDAPTLGPGDDSTRLDGKIGSAPLSPAIRPVDRALEPGAALGATTAFVTAAASAPTVTQGVASRPGISIATAALVTASNSVLGRTTSSEVVSARELFSLEHVDTPPTDPSLLPSVSSPPMSSPPAGWSLGHSKSRGPSSSAIVVVLGVSALVSLAAFGVLQATARLGLVGNAAGAAAPAQDSEPARVERPTERLPARVEGQGSRSSSPAAPLPVTPVRVPAAVSVPPMPVPVAASSPAPGAAQAVPEPGPPPSARVAPAPATSRPRPTALANSSESKIRPGRVLPGSGL